MRTPQTTATIAWTLTLLLSACDQPPPAASAPDPAPPAGSAEPTAPPFPASAVAATAQPPSKPVYPVSDATPLRPKRKLRSKELEAFQAAWDKAIAAADPDAFLKMRSDYVDDRDSAKSGYDASNWESMAEGGMGEFMVWGNAYDVSVEHGLAPWIAYVADAKKPVPVVPGGLLRLKMEDAFEAPQEDPGSGIGGVVGVVETSANGSSAADKTYSVGTPQLGDWPGFAGGSSSGWIMGTHKETGKKTPYNIFGVTAWFHIPAEHEPGSLKLTARMPWKKPTAKGPEDAEVTEELTLDFGPVPKPDRETLLCLWAFGIRLGEGQAKADGDDRAKAGGSGETPTAAEGKARVGLLHLAWADHLMQSFARHADPQVNEMAGKLAAHPDWVSKVSKGYDPEVVAKMENLARAAAELRNKLAKPLPSKEPEDKQSADPKTAPPSTAPQDNLPTPAAPPGPSAGKSLRDRLWSSPASAAEADTPPPPGSWRAKAVLEAAEKSKQTTPRPVSPTATAPPPPATAQNSDKERLLSILPGTWKEAGNAKSGRKFHIFDSNALRTQTGLYDDTGMQLVVPDAVADNVRIEVDADSGIREAGKGTIVRFFPIRGAAIKPERWLILSYTDNQIVYQYLTDSQPFGRSEASDKVTIIKTGASPVKAAAGSPQVTGQGENIESPLFDRLRAEQQAKSSALAASAGKSLLGKLWGDTDSAENAKAHPPITLSELERRFGGSPKIAQCLKSRSGEEFDILVWEDDPKLMHTAIRRGGVITSFGVSKKPVAEYFGSGGLTNFSISDYAAVDKDALFRAFAGGHQWARLGSASGALGKEEVYQRTDGALYGLASHGSASICTPDEFKQGHPGFQPDTGLRSVASPSATNTAQPSAAPNGAATEPDRLKPEPLHSGLGGAPAAQWPASKGELRGVIEVRVRNPNEFSVKVGLRSGGKGKDFSVSANGVKSVRVPNGSYDVYFQYSTDPDGLYQGDSFTLQNNGVEIQIVKVVNGNYGIRKVR